MNIVLISSLLIPKSIGGVEVLTVLLAKAFMQLGHNVTIITGGTLGKRFQDGVCVYEIPQLKLPLRLKGFMMPLYERALIQTLKDMDVIKNAHIINAVDLDSIIMLAHCDFIKQRFIATLQDYGILCANGLLLNGDDICPMFCQQQLGFLCLDKRKITIVQKIYLQIAYRIRKNYRDSKLPHLNHIICVSNFVRDQVRSYCTQANFSVIGNCLPEEWWNFKTKNTHNKDIDILYVGRLEEFKGIYVFLKAIKKYITAHPNAKVEIVGGGNINKCKKIISQYNLEKNVTLTYEKNYFNMEHYYKRAKIVVVPSVWPEPCGRVIIEAMFWGAAVISTRRGGTPELIEHNKTGLLIKAGDVNAITKNISYLLSNTSIRLQLSNNATKISMKKFRPYIIASQYEKVYNKVFASQEISI